VRVLLVALVAACGSPAAPASPAPAPFLVPAGAPPRVIAHRGGAALQPENTIVAYDHAVAMGVEVLDMDLCLTADGVLVLSHDLTIDRTSDGEGEIGELTADQLAAFNFGHDFVALDGSQPYRDQPVPIARFAEVLERFPAASYTIELKDGGPAGRQAARQVLAELAAHPPAGDVMVFSFLEDTAIELRALAPAEVAVGSSAAELFRFISAVGTDPDADPEVEATVLVVPRTLDGFTPVSSELVTAAHRQRLAVHYWTVNDPLDMQLMIDLGADGIITDRPDLLLDLLAQ
jgi:glycerophosphoryl diester phosphodiesterase